MGRESYWGAVAQNLQTYGIKLQGNTPICWQTLELICERRGFKRVNVLNPSNMSEVAVSFFRIREG